MHKCGEGRKLVVVLVITGWSNLPKEECVLTRGGNQLSIRLAACLGAAKETRRCRLIYGVTKEVLLVIRSRIKKQEMCPLKSGLTP